MAAKNKCQKYNYLVLNQLRQNRIHHNVHYRTDVTGTGRFWNYGDGKSKRRSICCGITISYLWL
jgi:hypothetical protein